MLTGNIGIFLLAIVFIIGLIIVQLFLAVLHDRVVTVQKPTRTLEALESTIASRQSDLEELQNKIKAQQSYLDNIDDIQAKYDATKRQLDELQAEWLQKDERRDEIRRLREEMEAEVIKKQALDAELANSRADLDMVQDRLAAAERLFAVNEEMKREHAELEAKIAEMRLQAVELDEAKQRVEQLQNRTNELNSDLARLEGLQNATTTQLADVQSQLEAERQALAQTHVEFTQETAKLAAAEELLKSIETESATLADIEARQQAATTKLEEAQSQLEAERQALAQTHVEFTQETAKLAIAEEQLNAIETEINKLVDRRGELQAQLATMDSEVSGASAGSAENVDEIVAKRLKDLQTLPPVLENMNKWKERAGENEAEAVQRLLVHIEQSGLQYDNRTIYAFHTAMKTNETTQMAVLAGISGTGKSQLPRQYAAGMGIGFLQVPVQPRWDSPQDLMGFYNYIEKRYRPTDMARALYQLDVLNNKDSAFKDRMMMILLDEMNLARVEYYFSDFLSRLESRPSIDRVGQKSLRKDAEIELEIPMPGGRPQPVIFPGYNLLFAGTMNEDESTQSLSDKVVDRANILRFPAPKTLKTKAIIGKTDEPQALSAARWRSWVKATNKSEVNNDVTANIEKMGDIMKQFKRPFGHRLGRAIMDYTNNYSFFGGDQNYRIPLADQVEMRLLPKLRGIDVEDVSALAFDQLKDFAEVTLGDDKLAQAIEASVQAAKEGSGQFVWNGMSR